MPMTRLADELLSAALCGTAGMQIAKKLTEANADKVRKQ
jgi:hypothetical protein